jgi:hypothetical protein
MNFVRLERKKGAKTDRWEVRNKRSNALLGRIQWHGAWRQYCFFPEGETIFNGACLGHIREFIGELMQMRKKHRKT